MTGPTLRRAVLVLGAMLPIGLLAFGLAIKAPEKGIDQALAEGRRSPAPDFRLKVLQAGSLPPALRTQRGVLGRDDLTLSDLRGSPIVLNYWASWCLPCREEAPLLERGWTRFGRRGVVFLGLNMQDLTQDARGFIREFGISYPNVRDQSDRTARKWGVTGLPETFFVDRRGGVVGHVIGVIGREQLEAGIEAAQRGRPLQAGQGGDRRSVR